MSPIYLIPPHRLVEAAGTKRIGPNVIVFADETYTITSLVWVRDVFAPAWAESMLLLGVRDWRADSQDCDDFARFCAGYAQLVNNSTLRKMEKPPAVSLAFGEFWYQQDAGGGHAINVFFHTDPTSGQLVPAFFEPQNATVVRLSSREIASCSFLRL